MPEGVREPAGHRYGDESSGKYKRMIDTMKEEAKITIGCRR